jgi:hypothetical protein
MADEGQALVAGENAAANQDNQVRFSFIHVYVNL